MRIVITRVGDSLIADGINLFIYELSDALIRLGHEVHLIPGVTENVYTGGNVSIFRKAVREMFSVKEVPDLNSLSFQYRMHTPLSSSLEQNLLFTLKGSRVIREISPDMVIFNGATTMFCPYFRVVVSHDLQFRLKIARYYDSLIYRAFDRIVAASTEIRQGLIRQLRLQAARITVIPICIDTSKFSVRAESKRIHAILHVGTRPEKRPDITIDAFERIASYDSELKLLIAGQIAKRDLPLLSRIKQKRNDVRKRISILGRVSKEKLAELYSVVKVTCVPSDYIVPVCSPTVIESIASGTPVVGSHSAISQDILIDGYNGFRVQPNNATVFASRLHSAISNNKLWGEMSKNALDVAQRCDKIKVAKDYLSLYEVYSAG